MGSIRVIAWSERSEPEGVYPQGINGALAEHLNTRPGIEAVVASLGEPDQGVSEEALAAAEVLMWFGHVRHGEVSGETVERVCRHVRERGLGYLALHSSHFALPLKALLGTSCAWRAYVEDGKPGHIRVVSPTHPIAAGVEDFTIPKEEWYGEPFEAPEPEAVILEGTYSDGVEVARDALVWTIGEGRVLYFRPGHETYPIYQMGEVQRIIENGVRWLARR